MIIFIVFLMTSPLAAVARRDWRGHFWGRKFSREDFAGVHLHLCWRQREPTSSSTLSVILLFPSKLWRNQSGQELVIKASICILISHTFESISQWSLGSSQLFCAFGSTGPCVSTEETGTRWGSEWVWHFCWWPLWGPMTKAELASKSPNVQSWACFTSASSSRDSRSFSGSRHMGWVWKGT